MNDIFSTGSLGWSTFFLLLAHWISPFLIIFIAVFYLAYLVLYKKTSNRFLILLLSFLIGLLLSYFLTSPISTILTTLYPVNNGSMWWDYSPPIIIVFVELGIVITHFRFSKKLHKTKSRKK